MATEGLKQVMSVPPDLTFGDLNSVDLNTDFQRQPERAGSGNSSNDMCDRRSRENDGVGLDPGIHPTNSFLDEKDEGVPNHKDLSLSEIPLLRKEILTAEYGHAKHQSDLKVLDFLEKLHSNFSTNCTANISSQNREQLCPVCNETVADKEETITCEMCLQTFCLGCSGLSKDIFDVTFAKVDNPCVLWMCNICRPLFPSLTELTQKVQTYESLAQGRLGQLENKINCVKH